MLEEIAADAMPPVGAYVTRGGVIAEVDDISPQGVYHLIDLMTPCDADEQPVILVNRDEMRGWERVIREELAGV